MAKNFTVRLTMANLIRGKQSILGSDLLDKISALDKCYIQVAGNAKVVIPISKDELERLAAANLSKTFRIAYDGASLGVSYISL